MSYPLPHDPAPLLPSEPQPPLDMLPVDAGPPPWLIFFLVMFIWKVPGLLWEQWSSVREVMQSEQKFSNEYVAMGLQAPSPTPFSVYFLGFVLENLGPFIILLALPIALIWQLRKIFLQRRHRFQLADPASSIGQGAIDGLRRLVPNVQIFTNWNQARLLAYVVPVGWWGAGVVLFGGFARLYRSNREAAEGVLLHEVAHLRRGDYRVIGVADFFRGILIFTAIGLSFFFVWNGSRFWKQMKQQQLATEQRKAQAAELQTLLNSIPHRDGEAPAELSPEVQNILKENEARMAELHAQGVPRDDSRLGWGWFYAQGLIWPSLGLCFRVLASLVLPIAAVWTAELHADRFVAQSGRTLVAHSLLDGPFPWWRRTWQSLTHPPRLLRRMAAAENTSRSLWVVLLLFPLAYLVRLVCLLLFATFQSLTPGMRMGWSEWPSTLHQHWQSFIGWNLESWAMLLVLLLVWPWVAPWWERFFTGRSDVASRKNYGRYLITAMFPLVLLGLGLKVRWPEIQKRWNSSAEQTDETGMLDYSRDSVTSTRAGFELQDIFQLHHACSRASPLWAAI